MAGHADAYRGIEAQNIPLLAPAQAVSFEFLPSYYLDALVDR